MAAIRRGFCAETVGLPVAAVDRDGSVYEYGINNNYVDGGVRPEMRILLRV